MTDNRQRTERSETVKAERRRRDDATLDGSQRLKLVIPPEVAARLKAENRTPYWATDEGNRIHQLTKMDDYDVVEGVEPVSTVVDRKTGQRANQILLSKPAAFIEEDRANADERRKETERALLRGKSPDGTATGDSFYADPANEIHHGERRLERRSP